MSYYESERIQLRDYLGRGIELAETTWAHIQDAHPEITL